MTDTRENIAEKIIENMRKNCESRSGKICEGTIVSYGKLIDFRCECGHRIKA